MAPRLYRIPEAAEQLGCSRRHVYDLIVAGHLATVNIGLGRSQSRISESELERFIRANTTSSRLRRTG